ncbi:MAG: hypothetical protein HYU41_12675 [Candidatus Rokubacteria bacterium]|nr:hypothetical protein [Candidatus Rokubacteria bacterium]
MTPASDAKNPVPPPSPPICQKCGKRLRDDDVITSDVGGVFHARCAPRAPDRLADFDDGAA